MSLFLYCFVPMKYEAYNELKITDDFSVIDFTNIGNKGEISKRIIFQETEWNNIYNLAFGDIDDDGEIDDFNVSNNGDRNKILATVAFAVIGYTEKHPERLIYFSGSTIERTRLYRMAISLNFEDLSSLFEIFVFIGNSIVPFINSNEITGFLVKRKNP